MALPSLSVPSCPVGGGSRVPVPLVSFGKRPSTAIPNRPSGWPNGFRTGCLIPSPAAMFSARVGSCCCHTTRSTAPWDFSKSMAGSTLKRCPSPRWAVVLRRITTRTHVCLKKARPEQSRERERGAGAWNPRSSHFHFLGHTYSGILAGFAPRTQFGSTGRVGFGLLFSG